ncbi:helix-turn-helix domain-containing protein [Deinococcus sonorensis]|uniref:Helix-turn-helix domain-containing protein n=2 Tax=Deinococcus sonorensis TaxID=309891 RepID=A0AAU7U5T0_9DEIO
MDSSWAAFGFWLHDGEPTVMAEAHRHGEVEFNYLRCGAITYLFGSGLLTLQTGRPLLFWGTRPHRLIACEPRTRLMVMTLPLATFLRFDLPPALRDPVLCGAPVVGPADTPGDEALLDRWLADASASDPEHRHIFELELNARLRRLALETRQAAQATPPQAASTPAQARRLRRAAQLAQQIAEHYADPALEIEAVARSAGLHPHYAAGVFREAFGLRMGAYLTQYRVAHAQRLLLTTALPALDVAAESGFGSVSRFYAAFRDATGQTPAGYRRNARADS